MADNSDLALLLSTLQDQHNALYLLMGTSGGKAGQAILLESAEVLHRMNLVQNLLLTQEAKAITDAVSDCTAAAATLALDEKAIADVGQFIESMSQYLAVVDTAIDIAKGVAALA